MMGNVFGVCAQSNEVYIYFNRRKRVPGVFPPFYVRRKKTYE